MTAGLISSEEMIHSATVICDSLKKIPCIGDGDTGTTYLSDDDDVHLN
jgi:phosphohistidine swiveling domain-containing protein